jgi:hypothetical protein
MLENVDTWPLYNAEIVKESMVYDVVSYGFMMSKMVAVGGCIL